MNRAAEIDLLKTLLHYLDTKTTCMADAPWRNEVSAFTCPERNKREQEILIRKRPLVMGLSCDWPKPGARREFLRARLNAEGRVELFPNQSSAVLTSTVWADGLVDNPASQAIRAGDIVRFLPLADLLH